MNTRIVRRGTKGLAVAIGLMFLGLAGTPFIRINHTVSMPRGVYAIEPHSTSFARGDIILMCLPIESATVALGRGYIAHGECPGDFEPLLKTIAAIDGDVVELTPHGASVNGSEISRTAPKAEDSEGRPMTIWPYGTYQVGLEEIWVISNHDDRSFDSRYFGPITVQNVIARASPLLVEK